MRRILFLIISLSFAGLVSAATVDTVLIRSIVMARDIKAVVITPDEYANGNTGFNVVYLLHGYTGVYKDWITNVPNLKSLADKYHIIYVCPDGGNSWYLDSPVLKSSQYETYIAKEVVNWTDGHYRTVKSKTGRAICGLSMGGHGAFYLAIRHPDTFGAAGSMSGGVDLCFKPKSFEKSKVLGDYLKHQKRWEENSVVNMLNGLESKNIALVFDCGESDFFININRKLNALLIAKGIKHQYTERPGGHTWDYWAVSIQSQTQFFSDFFNKK